MSKVFTQKLVDFMKYLDFICQWMSRTIKINF